MAGQYGHVKVQIIFYSSNKSGIIFDFGPIYPLTLLPQNSMPAYLLLNSIPACPPNVDFLP